MNISTEWLEDRAKKFRKIAHSQLDDYVDTVISSILSGSVINMGRLRIAFEFDISIKTHNIKTIVDTMSIVKENDGGGE